MSLLFIILSFGPCIGEISWALAILFKAATDFLLVSREFLTSGVFVGEGVFLDGDSYWLSKFKSSTMGSTRAAIESSSFYTDSRSESLDSDEVLSFSCPFLSEQSEEEHRLSISNKSPREIGWNMYLPIVGFLPKSFSYSFSSS
jgi:hypothetical protein